MCAKVAVTGAAGFIGSWLVQELLDQGHRVIGVDCFLKESYSSSVKRRNLSEVAGRENFKFHELDLRTDDLKPLADADVVINLAAMPGLPRSWTDFRVYSDCNLLAVQRLVEFARENRTPRFIQASTSSVYGRFAAGQKTSPENPCSPYGVTKLAADKLVMAYVENFGLS